MEPNEKVDLTNLRNVENIVRLYAETIFKRHHINPEHVDLHLSTEMNAIMNVFGGHKVHLWLKWPHAHLEINQLLKDFCKLFPKIHRTMEVVPFALAFQEKKWLREKFSTEEQIIFDLLPKHRLKISRKEIVTVEDTVTGESISIEHKGSSDRFEGEEVGMWIDLSRIINKKYPTENEDEKQA